MNIEKQLISFREEIAVHAQRILRDIGAASPELNEAILSTPIPDYLANVTPVTDSLPLVETAKDTPPINNNSKEQLRRYRLDLLTPAELAIHIALVELQKLRPDDRLTDVELKLLEAKNLVGDFVDDGLTKDEIKIGGKYLHQNGHLVKVWGKNDGLIPIECEWLTPPGGVFACVPAYLIKEVNP